MKRLIWLVLSLVLMCLTVFAEEEKFDFRKTVWGMSVKEVVSSELPKRPLKREKENIFFRDKIDNKTCLILYSFNDNKLISGTYSFIHEQDLPLYIDDFKHLKDMLTHKYGKPKHDEIIWKDRYYENSFNDYGYAVSMGHMVFMTQWETEKSIIRLGLMGENNKVNLLITYMNRYYIENEKPKYDDKTINKL